jgi:chromosomal replication initiator protein
MLLIDDLDKLEGKPSCQAEFLSILEIAKQNEIKIAVSMGQLPRLTPGLNQMLVERLQSGLVCSVGPMDSIGKTRLLQQFLNRLGVGLVTEDFYHKAGDLLPESAREIEGIAQKVWLLGRLECRPIDLDLLKVALQDDSRPSCSPTIESIAQTVAGILGISAEAIIGRSKSPILEMGRMFSYYLARKHSCHSAAEVGAFFQGRSHSTIINGANQVEKRLVNLNQANRWPQNWKLLLKQAGQILNKG